MIVLHIGCGIGAQLMGAVICSLPFYSKREDESKFHATRTLVRGTSTVFASQILINPEYVFTASAAAALAKGKLALPSAAARIAAMVTSFVICGYLGQDSQSGKKTGDIYNRINFMIAGVAWLVSAQVMFVCGPVLGLIANQAMAFAAGYFLPNNL